MVPERSTTILHDSASRHHPFAHDADRDDLRSSRQRAGASVRARSAALSTNSRSTSALVPAAFSWVSLFTSMFIHGGVMHVGGNMLYLWIFGDNVEDRMGHGRFLVFYLLCGVAAALAQTITVPDSVVPMVGASGAIAGVMGAYFVLYPKSRIVTLIPLFFFFQVIEVPAIFFLGIWFLMQFLNGLGSIATTTGRGSMGGIAFWAHVAGFVAGISGVVVFRRPERQRVEWWHDV
jgi:membrane associated rhomboid family serine protease